MSLNRFTEIGSMSELVRRAIRRITVPAMALIVVECAFLFLTDRPGATAFALMSMATCVSLGIWMGSACGLPLLPLFLVQNLIIYGLPIVVSHSVLTEYPDSFVLRAGLEVLIMDLAMAFAWRIGMQIFKPSPPVSYALRELNRSGARGWARLGFALALIGTVSQGLAGFGYLDTWFHMLPNGTSSAANALFSVMSTCGVFLVSLAIGANEASAFSRCVFWIVIVANFMVSSSDFILAGSAATLVTIAVGFFWGRGKFPWRYLTIAMLALSFLNTGKTAMRLKYWTAVDGEPGSQFKFADLPSIDFEWVQVSFDAIVNKAPSLTVGLRNKIVIGEKNQTLLDRINNLQNLLFVIDAVETDHVSLLHGATYAVIPPLLVPRVFWPDKPRSHEGQIILNVHFGRQDLNSTYETYIAWGLLPEAYGNFGPIGGSVTLGVFLGILFAWVENLTARKLVISIEGFLSLSALMNIMNSFEMVASVLVTVLFQSFCIIIGASLPFVQRTVMHKDDPPEP
jgi:hypothetical protein